ncbi:MAG: protein-disulfide reductase DsbD [Burkholderiales bacterium]|nr:protein-disulfide reductase DsbD [Burkholderiales bacterium]
MRWILVLVAILGLGCAQAEEPLPPEQAFKLSARLLDSQTLLVRYDIERGYYMYRDKFQFEAPPVALGQAQMPPGKLKDDPIFGRVETYRDRVEIKIPIAPSGAVPAVLKLKATSQGCADLGVCYPPQEQFAELRLAAMSTGAAASPRATADAPGTAFVTAAGLPDSAAAGSEESAIVALLASGSFWLVVLSFFGFGIALAFTPCMLPMIPILSGIVVGGREVSTRGRAFLLSLTYVLGMAITYAAAGVAAGVSGSMLAAALQSPWLLGSFAVLFVLLACSMFGLYELQLPSGVQSWLAERSNHLRGGQALGVFVMGVLSALIIGPCIAPPLAGALLFIAERGEVALGGTALFAMALGMGVPLVGVGVSAGSLMPKAGPWMESVKNFFGVVLLGVAIWVVSPVLPTVVQMLAWGALLMTSSIYLHAIDPLPANASGFRKLWKGIGVIALLAGAALVLGALAGGRDILQPLAGLRAAASAGTSAATASPPVSFERVADTVALDAKLAAARGQPVMLDFYADWCVACKEMERFTFSDEAVKRRMREFVLLKADVTANSGADKALLKQFSLFGPPGIIFFDRDGRELKPLRVIGFKPAERFAATLDQALR